MRDEYKDDSQLENLGCASSLVVASTTQMSLSMIISSLDHRQ